MTKQTRKINNTDNDEYMIDLAQQTFAIPDSFYYKVVVVTAGQIARPDLISMDLYNTDSYGDLICKLNNIPDPFSLNEGDRLIVPAPESISSFMTNDPYDDDDMAYGFAPVAKNKKEKRKANDAIVGDVRYKIDQSNRIIIY